MNERSYSYNGEISLVDVYRFIKECWKTFVFAVALGGAIGASFSYRLSDQFAATGLMRPAQVADVPLEDINVLVEKMRSPTFLTAKTHGACGTAGAEQLSNAINATVSRQSAFISVSYTSGNPQLPRDCLQAVLRDVNENQAELMSARSKSIEDDLTASKKLLAYADAKQRNELALIQQGLELAKQELVDAKLILGQLESAAARFPSGEERSLESSLLLSVLLAKKADLRNIESAIQEFEKSRQLLLASEEGISLEFKREIYERDKTGALLKKEEKSSTLRAHIRELERDLQPPETAAASFVVPVYVSERPVGSRRIVMIVAGLMLGGVVGLGLLMVRRFVKFSGAKLG